jgi:hypothetical protein
MIRVTDWRRWNRVKATALFIICVALVWSLDGFNLEAEAGDALPSLWPALPLAFGALALALSLIGTRNR